jgi:hypothetical protein
MTRPCRRITLHLSQIGLTLGFTFTAVSILFCVSRRLGFLAFRYLYRYTMRPRERSYGDNSTTTRSSGRMRM